MRGHLLKLMTAALFAFASTVTASDMPQHDQAGAHDNAIVSRFAGSVIIGYKTSDFDALTIPLAAFGSTGFAKTDSAQGHVTRITYAAPAGKSLHEVASNFEQALANAGFNKRFSCNGTPGSAGCGNASGMSQALMPEDLINSLSTDTGNSNLMISTLWSNGGSVFLESAHLDRPAGAVDVVLFASGNDGQPVGIYLQINEAKAMSVGEVTVDAKAMAQGLAQQGHMALYGIHFGTDSAQVTADSRPTLQQMALLLKSQPALKVYIVGHTDNTGALEHNTALSTQRAQAVVKALQDMGIAANRMIPKGLASLAPVASNATEDGKAKNRRVELVEQ